MKTRKRKERRCVPPPIQSEAWYERRDLRLLLPWLGDEALSVAKRAGRLRYAVVESRGDSTRGQKHLYKGEWLRAWLDSFPAGGS